MKSSGSKRKKLGKNKLLKQKASELKRDGKSERLVRNKIRKRNSLEHGVLSRHWKCIAYSNFNFTCLY